MNVDTEAIRRLRDHLLTTSNALGAADARSETTSAAMLKRVEPFAETMFLVMSADQHRAAAEEDTLRAALAVLTANALPAAALEALLLTFQANLAREGREARIARIGAAISRDRDDRETAFALAAAVAVADDRIDAAENQALEWVREYCGLTERQARGVLNADG